MLPIDPGGIVWQFISHLPSNMSRWLNRAGPLVLAVGIGLRGVRLLESRPLWLDEVLIALNVLTRTPLQLLRPLDDKQLSPLGFLWGEWLVTRLGGFGERAFRFLPFVAAIVALFVFARLARRMLPPGAALLATALAALSPLLIYYSAEVKSYGFDWLAAVLLMHATLKVADGESDVAWVHWALAAAFASMFSTAAPFVVGGCALALLTVSHVRQPRAMLRLTAASAVAAAIFGVHLFTVYHSSSTTSFMQLYWGEMFLEPRVPAALSHLVRLAREFWSAVLFSEGIIPALPRKTMTFLVALSAVGIVSLARRSPAMAVMLVAPALAVGVASLLELWPLTPRLLLFAAPAVLITMPAGLHAVAQLAPGRVRGLAIGIASAALVVTAAIGMRRDWSATRRFAQVPEALRLIAANAGQNATVYMSSDLEAPCKYYLVWHPDRAALGGDPSTHGCSITDTRTVIGKWPQFVGVAPGAATSRPKVIRPEWLESEGRRILSEPTTEIWLVIGYNTPGPSPLPQWLEAAGAKQVAEQGWRTLHIWTYQPPPIGGR